MKDILEGWLTARVVCHLLGGQQGLIGFEGRLLRVTDELVEIQQDTGALTLVRIELLAAVHRVPTVQPAALKILGPKGN